MSHLTKLQSAMKAAHTEAIVVSSEINQRYLSGLNYTDGFVVVLPEKAFLLADFRYIEDARTQVDAHEFEIVMPDRSMLAYVAAILKDYGVKVSLFEEATLSYSLLERFKKTFEGVELVSGASAMIDGLRLYKDARDRENVPRPEADRRRLRPHPGFHQPRPHRGGGGSGAGVLHAGPRLRGDRL